MLDKEGNQVVAARYRQSEFGMHNINWDFVGIQKRDFEDRRATSKHDKVEENHEDSEDD